MNIIPTRGNKADSAPLVRELCSGWVEPHSNGFSCSNGHARKVLRSPVLILQPPAIQVLLGSTCIDQGHRLFSGVMSFGIDQRRNNAYVARGHRRHPAASTSTAAIFLILCAQEDGVEGADMALVVAAKDLEVVASTIDHRFLRRPRSEMRAHGAQGEQSLNAAADEKAANLL